MKFCNAMIGVAPTAMGRVAQAAEAVGFDEVAVSDHVIYPENLESSYPYTADGRPQFDPDEDWPDVWVTIGAMAAVTTTLRFVTNVYVLPLRNPFVVAKAVGTAAHLSGGRVHLGIGAGWMREEFELLGQTFARRGARMDEMIDLMRALWSGGMVEHHGEFYDVDPVEMRPTPPEPVPIVIGGHSEIALRRAARIGDGWLGVQYSMERLAELCATLHRYRDEAGTADRPFSIIASPMVAPDVDAVESLAAMGVTTIMTSAWRAARVNRPSPEEAVDRLGQYAERFITPLRG